MRLSDIVKNMEFGLIKGSLDQSIESITYNSCDARTNSLFVAVSGFATDGHEFIEDAISKGAKAIIVEKPVIIDENVTVLLVEDSRLALARVASHFYGQPTANLPLIGITGTNGKTSTTFFLKSILEHAQKSVGVIGTMGTFINDVHLPTKNTTPESLNLQQIFAEMNEKQVEQCVMEVSSHSLSLNRVAYCDFNSAIFTNLSPDHLELHKTMDEYFLAKAKLFDLSTEYNIINADDPYGRRLIDLVKNRSVKIVTYGIHHPSDIYPSSIHYGKNYTHFTLHTPTGTIDIQVHVPGEINVYNSLAAIACAYSHGFTLEQIKQGIEAVQSIKGRFEEIYQDEDIRVFVDFAHTEDGLHKALDTLRPITEGRLMVVFGVYAPPGKEGREKRLAMGKVAAEYADFAIVTSDNPKHQDPHAIIREVVEALDESNGHYEVKVDRKEAIHFALDRARKGDVILLAGKGHETTQVIGDKEIPFNESEIVRLYMNNRKVLL